MADPYRKLAIGRVLMRTAFAIGMLAWLFKYGIDRSVTLGNFIEAVQATPLALVLFLDTMDYFVDRTAYHRMYNLVYQRMTGGQKNDFAAILAPVIVSAAIFFGMLAILGGAVTLNLGEYNPGVLLWVGLMSTYAMLPETGDEPWMTIIWLSAQLIGGFHNVVILPQGLLG